MTMLWGLSNRLISCFLYHLGAVRLYEADYHKKATAFNSKAMNAIFNAVSMEEFKRI